MRARLQRGLLQAPAWLYRHHLGWLGGRHFLLLSHRGRRSGRLYQTVLEVIDHNRVTQESVVMSGPGTAAQWYQNILAFPAVRVQIGRLAFEPQQRLLTLDEARDTALRFAHAHPLEARLAPRVLRWLGWGDTAPLDSVELIASLPMVAFRPRRV